MLKAHIKDNGKSYVKCNETPERLAIEVSIVVKLIFQSIKRKSPGTENEFKNTLIGLLLDPRSPVWQEDDHG